jgi:TPR repeat protein
MRVWIALLLVGLLSASPLSQDIKKCLQGDGKECLNVGRNYQEGLSTLPNLKKALFFYKKGCELGNRESCAWLGVLYLKGVGGSKEKGVELLKKYALPAKVGEGLYLLGLWYLRHHNYSDAYNSLYYACSLLDGRGCCLLGKLIYQGIFKFGFDRWASYLEKGCELMDFDCCRSIIYNKDLDWNTKKEVLLKLYNLCEEGTGQACTIYGEYLRTSGVIKGGMKFLKRGCELGDGEGCYLVVEDALKRGEGNTTTLSHFLQLGCSYGNKKCCNLLRHLTETHISENR